MFAKIVGSTTYYYIRDALGSTRQVWQRGQTSAAFSVATYKPYGTPVTPSGTEKFEYAGEMIVSVAGTSTGLYYIGARWMDPETGRWLSLDPELGNLSAPQTLDRYVYCVNNPLTVTDPTGERGHSGRHGPIGGFKRHFSAPTTPVVTSIVYDGYYVPEEWMDFPLEFGMEGLYFCVVSSAVLLTCPGTLAMTTGFEYLYDWGATGEGSIGGFVNANMLGYNRGLMLGYYFFTDSLDEYDEGAIDEQAMRDYGFIGNNVDRSIAWLFSPHPFIPFEFF